MNPSKAIAAVVRTLRDKLGQGITVRSLGALFSADVSDLNSLPSPGVYVSMLRMPESERDYDPPAVDVRLMALVLARDPRPTEEELTRDDVAMNIAAIVQSVVMRTRFPDADGVNAFFQRAYNVAAVNSYTPEFQRKGLAVWRVEWTQCLELTDEDAASTLVKLREIRMVAEMGDANTPDAGVNAGEWT